MGIPAGTGINEINRRLSASISRVQPGIANNIYKRQPFVEWLKEQKKIYNGGTEVKVKFRYAKAGKLADTNGAKAFQYYDELNTAPTDTVKTGRALMKNIQIPVTISHEEMIENKGENQFDVFKTELDAAMSQFAEEMNDICWGITGVSDDLVPESIPGIVSGADAGTIHGLSKASNTWMYSQRNTAVGDVADFLVDAMRTGRNSCMDNAPSKNDKLDLWITDQTVYEAFEDIHPTFLQYPSNKGVDIGFEQLIYTGVPVRFDSSCPLDSGGNHQMFGLMSKYWEMAVDKSWNMKTTEFYDMLPKQAVSTAQIIHRFCIINNNPRTNVRLSGITT